MIDDRYSRDPWRLTESRLKSLREAAKRAPWLRRDYLTAYWQRVDELAQRKRPWSLADWKERQVKREKAERRAQEIREEAEA